MRNWSTWDRLAYAVLLAVIAVAGGLTAHDNLGLAWVYAILGLPFLLALAIVNAFAWGSDQRAAREPEAAASRLWPHQRGRLRVLTYAGLGWAAVMTTGVLLGGNLVAAILAFPLVLGLDLLRAFPVLLEIFPLIIGAPVVVVTLEALYTCLVDGYKGGGSLVAAVKAAFEKPAGKRVRWLVMWIGVFGLLPGLLARHEQRYPIHCACTTSYLRFTHADGLHVRLGWPVGWWPTGVVDLGDVLQAPFGLIADIFLVGALAAFIMLGVIAIYRLVIAVRSKGSGAAPLAQGDSHVTDDH